MRKAKGERRNGKEERRKNTNKKESNRIFFVLSKFCFDARMKFEEFDSDGGTEFCQDLDFLRFCVSMLVTL